MTDAIITQYSNSIYNRLVESRQYQRRIETALGPRDKQFLQKFVKIGASLENYKDATSLDKALDTIDLGFIYSEVQKKEEELKQDDLKYNNLHNQDIMVLVLLDYFKNNFFKWVTKPECPRCETDENVRGTGAIRAPANNPDGVTVIETYACSHCFSKIEFPRINLCTKLLETRRGRCGEWVNCFMLILQAVLGADTFIRYVWNNEDHVWCEYFSTGMKRWIHLDPCEAAFDQPDLYVNNWGKKMSYVIGINDAYFIDLSDKYITNKDKQIPKESVVDSPRAVLNFILFLGYQTMVKYFNQVIGPSPDKWKRFYYECWLLFSRERSGSRQQETAAVEKIEVKGRQTGGEEWTKTRGEGGQ